MQEGRVSVDGKIVTEMGLKFNPEGHDIRLDGRPVVLEEKKIYILLNKPTGYVTTLHDPQGRPIVTSLVPEISERVFPVGRLDFDTEGALLLTNDGDLAQRIQHPSFEVNKTYLAQVTGRPSLEKIKNLEQGILLEGRRTSPAQLKVMRSSSRDSLIQIIIHEGRKRQVRKMFAAIGHPVITLKRIAYGNLSLGSLPSGKYRLLQKKDLEKIIS